MLCLLLFWFPSRLARLRRDISRSRIRTWDSANSPKRFCLYAYVFRPAPLRCTSDRSRLSFFRFFRCVCIPDTASNPENNRIFRGAPSFFPDRIPDKFYLLRRLGVFFAAPRLREEAWCLCSSENQCRRGTARTGRISSPLVCRRSGKGC